MNLTVRFVCLILLFQLNTLVVFAHPGGTDGAGCHTCRTNCPNWGLSYDEYHCHNAKVLPQPEPPITSTYGDGGTGYTEYEPAYEEKAPVAIVVPATTVESSTATVKVAPVAGVGSATAVDGAREEDVAAEIKEGSPEESESIVNDAEAEPLSDGATVLILLAVGGGIWWWKKK